MDNGKLIMDNFRMAGRAFSLNFSCLTTIVSMVQSQQELIEKRRIDNLKMKENVVKDKSFDFALRVVKLAKYLEGEKKEYILCKQVLRSGTAIGALVREAEHAESKADFVHKMSIALKEANETSYWLELLHQGGYIDEQSFQSIGLHSEELIKLLIAIVKTSKVSKLSE